MSRLFRQSEPWADGDAKADVGQTHPLSSPVRHFPDLLAFLIILSGLIEYNLYSHTDVAVPNVGR